MTANALPTVRFGDHDVTRLIVGGNQIRGFSHVDEDLDQEMRDWHSVENTLRMWQDCEQNGINTMQMRGDAVIYERLRAYREAGGSMHWICQTAGEHPDPIANIREIAEYDPIAIYHHGSVSDRMWQEGSFAKVEDRLKAMRDTGALVGIAAHIPEIHHHVADRQWDVDFHMTCFYNLSKEGKRGLVSKGESVEEQFDDDDRDVICRFIRQTDKTCIAYKILAASRKCGSPDSIRNAFKFAFDRIKPNDFVDVGMFQKHGDQVAENAAIVRDLLQ